jgi:hypothetical protein
MWIKSQEAAVEGALKVKAAEAAESKAAKKGKKK